MAITYEASAADVARVRLTPSPIGEAVFSLRALARPGAASQFGPFLEYARGRLRGVDIRVLRSLVPSTGYVPDVLTPSPRFAPSFLTQLEEVRATPAEEFAAQVDWMARDPGTTRQWKARTATARAFLQATDLPETIAPPAGIAAAQKSGEPANQIKQVLSGGKIATQSPGLAQLPMYSEIHKQLVQSNTKIQLGLPRHFSPKTQMLFTPTGHRELVSGREK
ncbi:hypothetical protein [Rathayibacter iranicus]|uniref:Uncharacterized protein n=2 Tax=Rathayibacter iranicus TaxID=59737 RepID=A0AAD1AF11_9MICO|nr:hypothetical protein [Rathayibacter iranicus]AZZ55930.1 hypothetical protein C7V51_08630 [Rathayibacter iranicus]MWV30622.1 hypothetical protein [Rathayibacter iranicus NCPPB 2253 = VKM Ac-1602]PPI47084.1 hypothetical protein C5E09_07665 [Rathayibacter iranicus]PPI60084.1 hypothetical protein C5E08_08595 [Rathayibacter iranicus]PPI71648.1 hypothetical protein C5E01_07630 [Rathayibacter iranicus]